MYNDIPAHVEGEYKLCTYTEIVNCMDTKGHISSIMLVNTTSPHMQYISGGVLTSSYVFIICSTFLFKYTAGFVSMLVKSSRLLR